MGFACRGWAAIGLVLCVCSCAFVSQTIRTGGAMRQTRLAPRAKQHAPRLIIFALDGAIPAALNQALASGKAPRMAALLGKNLGGGLFEHGYAAPHALAVLPSSTIADWSAQFTGQTPATDGVVGDEWFDRTTMRFYAPVPVSVSSTNDLVQVMTADLVGKALKVPTLYELLHERAYVSMLSVHRGATYFTTVPPASFAALMSDLIAGALDGQGVAKSVSASLDSASVQEVIDALNQHGIPDLQVVYFPGIDIFTHASRDTVASQAAYLEGVTDPGIGRVLDTYRAMGALDDTYVILIADHSHIPTIDDEQHELGVDFTDSPFAVVRRAGFRVRPAVLSTTEPDFQAVLAYQGFMAFVYLADRATCPQPGQRCRWTVPPRFEGDVMPVVRALYEANVSGAGAPKLRHSIDLIFARQPVAAGQPARPFEIFDGRRLVPIPEYLRRHPRPDLVDLNERMRWLGAGPYGNLAGDIVLLARACDNLPIEDRYYFAGVTHHSWHGSACEGDSHIPFILAQQGDDGARLKAIMQMFGHSPSERDLTPLALSLLGRVKAPAPAASH
jgi:hypothetical protein